MKSLTVNHVTKRFKEKLALSDVSCTFTNGITALLGPNGAGKSTLMNILCTLIEPNEGDVTYNGSDIRSMGDAYRRRIAIQFQDQPMYKNHTGDEYLQFCGALKEMKKSEIAEQSNALLQHFGIIDCRKKKISTYSGGMRQRLALCGTFLGNPEIIFLDEPSAGLDIYEREELKSLLCDMKTERIIIISTHIVSDVENIADEIVMLNHGSIHSHGSQSQLVEGLNRTVWEIPKEKQADCHCKIYRSNGKVCCLSDTSPCEGAIEKKADLTDVYFHCCL